MSKSVFECPICGKEMNRDARSYRCGTGHCFDIAKEGYVNLLPANRRHSELPGDDREMVRARTMFLDGGWYAPLRDELCILADERTKEKAILVDAGCGEGYYTEALANIISKKGGKTAGIDLSKAAARKASRRCPEVEIAVASVYRMPLAKQSVNVVANCFAPLAIEEFARILKPHGWFLYVVPGQRHLWEMKEILYERPYENELREESYAGFRQAGEFPVEFRFRLEKQEEIAALLRMTPYSWKTPKSGIERLTEYRELEITAQFRILVFEKEA